MKKKFLKALLMGAVLTTALSGCGEKAKDSSKVTGSQETKTQEANSDGKTSGDQKLTIMLSSGDSGNEAMGTVIAFKKN